MQKWIFFGAALFLGGCATHGCDTTLPGSPCRAQHLLYQNDMIQAKVLISERHSESYELASALLERASRDDASGEAQFYQAVLLIRQRGDETETTRLLQQSADRHYPLAIALLAQRAGMQDQEKARAYRVQYDQLDVAKSGYPSFSQALIVVNTLVSAND
ncbi:hypothetical protein [Pseudomonas huanghezhanensis]|uniref:hypothetical protein n=1 Tax=Pseudomonas huanghezhanensis TaxID=3002903 RepID=UPI0022856DFE|nr:hypothetical protein [Pseudomonas sp. BSw22131]